MLAEPPLQKVVVGRAQFGIHPGRHFCVTFWCSGEERKRESLEGSLIVVVERAQLRIGSATLTIYRGELITAMWGEGQFGIHPGHPFCVMFERSGGE